MTTASNRVLCSDSDALRRTVRDEPERLGLCRRFKEWLRNKVVPYFYQKVVFGMVLRTYLEGYFEICVATLPAMTIVRL